MIDTSKPGQFGGSIGGGSLVSSIEPRVGQQVAKTRLSEVLAFYLQSCRGHEQSLAQHPDQHETLYKLSVLRLLMSVILRESQGDPALVGENMNRALEAISIALWIRPGNDVYWTHLSECLANASLRYPLDERVRDLLSRALEHPCVPPLALANPIVSLLQSHQFARELASPPAWQAGADGTGGPALLSQFDQLLNEPLLLRLLAMTVVPNALIERLLTLARRESMLETARALSAKAPMSFAVLNAMAQQCFATEYVYEVNEPESVAVAALEHAIQAGLANNQPIPPHWIALFACYRPLHALFAGGHDQGPATRPPKEQHASVWDTPELADLVRTQLVEPAEEARLRSAMPSVTGAGNPVSTAVGAQYESHPYPRWLKAVRVAPAGGLHAHLRQLIPYSAFIPSSGSTPQILVAGCGTGQQSIETAQRYPDARILAIDLSLSSLAYASRKTLELGLKNIDYRQCDILDAASIDECFDYIESIGVLHHLEDPLRGWEVLRRRLKPRGIMRIGLYSEMARAELDPLTARVAAMSLRPDLEGIRRCRSAVRQMIDPAASSLEYSPDFYSASGCRDMLFHAMEHRFNLQQIAEMLKELNLEFLGFHLPTPAMMERFRSEFPESIAARNLDNWHRFETMNPWIFRGMYKLWVQARD